MSIEKKEDEIDWDLVRFWLKINFINLFIDKASYLTHYYPFSRFFRDRKFHYKNRYLLQFDNLLWRELQVFKKYSPFLNVSLVMEEFIIFFISMKIKGIDEFENYKEKLMENISKKSKISKNIMYLNATEEPGIWKLLVPRRYIYRD